MAKYKATLTVTFETSDEKEWLNILDFKRYVVSGELQREFSYHSRADRDNPKVQPKIKVTATFKEE